MQKVLYIKREPSIGSIAIMLYGVNKLAVVAASRIVKMHKDAYDVYIVGIVDSKQRGGYVHYFFSITMATEKLESLLVILAAELALLNEAFSLEEETKELAVA